MTPVLLLFRPFGHGTSIGRLPGSEQKATIFTATAAAWTRSDHVAPSRLQDIDGVQLHVCADARRFFIMSWVRN